MSPPPKTLDGADVIYWITSDKPFYYIPEGAIQHPIMAMAICRYAKPITPPGKVYLFKCDGDWNVVMDMDYHSADEAMAAASQWHIRVSDWRS
jgi:hypothetical protein